MEKQKLVIDHANRCASVFLIVLGGQITLTTAYIKTEENLILASLSMFLMLTACIGYLSIAEQVVRKLGPKPKFKWKINQIVFGSSYMPKSVESQYVYTSLALICFLVSLVLFLTTLMNEIT